MSQPIVPLLGQSFRAWISARGFIMVTAAALVPLLLTGAWVATHRDDVAASEPAGLPADLREGDNVTITTLVTNVGGTRVGSFNATLAVGSVFAGRLTPVASETVAIDSLGGDETRTVSLNWTARPGTWYVLADADTDDSIGEVEEFNNQKAVPIAVGYARAKPEDAPKAPGNLTGDAGANATADARLADLAVGGPVRGGSPHNFTVTIANGGPDRLENASVTLRVVRFFGATAVPMGERTDAVSLDAGASQPFTFEWIPRDGTFWLEAFVNVTGANDPDAGNNHVTESFSVDPVVTDEMKPPEPPEKLTIKEFYLDVLSLLHLRILIPFIALFYAGGVIADERERGALAYLLTRPVQRWLIPVAKFAASFLVAAVAIVVGILATYALLFGTTPQGSDVGFLSTPLLVSVISLFVYGTFFVLLGVLVERPYLVGAAIVIGWETVASSFVPWVQYFTLSHHVANAIQGWRLDEGLQWLPATPEGVTALRWLVIAAVAFLVASAVVVKRKEFEI